MHGRRIAGRAVAALALLAAVACGDDDGDSAAPTTTSTTTDDRASRQVDQDVLDRVAHAVQATVGEGTARFTVTVETEDTGSGGDGTQPIEVDGEVDFDAEQRLLTLAGGQGELDVVVDGDVAYLELPATEGDDWMRIELEALFDDDVGMGGPAAIPFQDPEDNLRLLQGSAVHAAEEGEESVGGDDTTRYNLVIDLEAAAEEADDEVQDAVDETVDRTRLDELGMDVWIDDDDLIRRVAYTLDLDQAELSERDDEGSVEADPQGSVTVTVDYTDFGVEVDIEVPDDADVVDLDEDAVRDAIDDAGGSSSGPGTSSTSTTTGDDDTDEDDDETTTTSSTTSTTTGG
jgi:hypothetical protein